MSRKPPNPTPQDLQAALAAWRAQVAQAKHPWLAAILLKQWERFLRRVVSYYQQLRALPRHTRRAWQKQLGLSLAGAALLLALAGPLAPPVHAATITVDGTTCTLADAITAANTDTATGGCAAGSGADTISLQTDVTLTGMLPNITTQMTIEGNGHTINGNNAVFHVLYVTNTGDLTLNNATITGGNANGSWPHNIGGGIFNNGTLTVTNSTISGNSAYEGGGIVNYGGTLTVSNSTISGNTATIGDGGGIVNYGGTLTVSNSTISGNSATNGGGGIDNNGPVTVTNSTISGNSAYEGGGIDNNGPVTVTVTNSTISGNSATYGGGIDNNFGTVTLNRSLISGNTAAGRGNEIYNFNGSFTTNNYNLFGHSGETNAQAFNGFTPCSGAGCTDITATSDGTNPTALTSILNTTLTNQGGGTKIHHLVPGSPAVDAAPSAACSAAPVNGVDQRGKPRNVDGNGASSSNECDIGAHELQSPTAVTLQSLTASSGGGSGGLAAMLGAISLALGGLWLRRRKS